MITLTKIDNSLVTVNADEIEIVEFKKKRDIKKKKQNKKKVN